MAGTGGDDVRVVAARRRAEAPEAVDVRLGGDAFLVNRAAGLGPHLIAQHLVVPTGLRYAEDVIDGLRSPLLLAVEVAVLAFVTYHALAGVRVVLFDIGFSVRTERRIVSALRIVWIGTVIYGVALFAAILNAA